MPMKRVEIQGKARTKGGEGVVGQVDVEQGDVQGGFDFERNVRTYKRAEKRQRGLFRSVMHVAVAGAP